MGTYTGNANDNLLRGSTGADTLIGLAGDDTYVVNSLDDVVVEALDEGTDSVQTSVLDDLATYSLAPFAFVENLSYTGALAAKLKGNTLDNVIAANSKTAVADTLYGNAGNDTLYGYGGNDLLIGGTGDDFLDGGKGVDRMVGGSGNDTYVVDSSQDRVYEYLNGGLLDTIQSAVQKDLRLAWTQQIEGLTYTGTTAATLHGNALGNTLTSLSSTADTLNGYDGNDILDGGGGRDILVGGHGNDLYFASTVDTVKELADDGNDTIAGTVTDISVTAYAKTIENLFYTGVVGATVNGNALDNTVSGGNGADTVNGDVGNDYLFGGAGKDKLVGGAGSDHLYGGGVDGYTFQSPFVADTAADTLVGGADNDYYWIDSARDSIVEAATGGTLDAVISSIDNSLTRYANVEALVLQRGSDAWYGEGSSRNDILVGNAGDNYLVGGAGNDTLSSDFVDNASFGPSSDVLDGGDGNDILIASDFGSYFGYVREVTMFGGAGNDLYVFGGYSGTRLGGQDDSGTDTVLLLGSGSIETLAGVENIVLGGAGGSVESRALEAIGNVYSASHDGRAFTASLGFGYDATGNDLDNQITGNSQGNVLKGLDGDDTLIGGDGNDTLDGGDGTDALQGGAGDDQYVVSVGDSVVEALNGGFDIVLSDTVTSLRGFDNIEGLQYTGSADVTLKNATGNTTNDFFIGGSGDDTLAGYGGDDTLDGGDGNDKLLGGAGNDDLKGSGGNDTLTAGAGDDSLNGGDGNDTIDGEAGADTIYGGAGVDTIDGGSENDTIFGGAGTETLTGGDGNDNLYSGDDYYYPDTVSSTQRGGNGDDGLNGSTAADALSGDAGNDSIYGNDGNDNLKGGEGNDGINGGAGNDRIAGGNVSNSGLYYQTGGDLLSGDGGSIDNGASGRDIFHFDAPTTATAAVETSSGSGQFYFNTGALISDFSAGTDTIELGKARVGDGDVKLEGVDVKTSAELSFSRTAELVIFQEEVASSFGYAGGISYFGAATVTAVIGEANAAFAVGDERLFVVDDGTSSAIFQFTARNADKVVDIDELSLVSIVYGNAALSAGDFVLA